MSDVTEHRLTPPLACYYDLFTPPGDERRPLLVALHGYGGDKASMMRLARRIVGDEAFVIAALQGPHHHLVMPTKESPQLGYGFGWLSNFKPEDSIALHHALVREVIATLMASGQADPARVFLLGFSQSVALNFRLAFTQPDLIRGVVAICGGIPGDWPKAEEAEGKYKKSEVDVLYLAAERDEYYTPERMRRNAEALETRARTVEFQSFDAAHEVPRASYAPIRQWLARQAGL